MRPEWLLYWLPEQRHFLSDGPVTGSTQVEVIKIKPPMPRDYSSFSNLNGRTLLGICQLPVPYFRSSTLRRAPVLISEDGPKSGTDGTVRAGKARKEVLNSPSQLLGPLTCAMATLTSVCSSAVPPSHHPTVTCRRGIIRLSNCDTIEVPGLRRW